MTRQDRLYQWATLALFAAALAVVLATFQDYGITWDENYHHDYGRHVLNYYLSGLVDRTALTYHNLWLYGAAFDLPAAIAKRLLPFGGYETQHLMIALAGLLGVFGVYRVAAVLAGRRAGFWAALLLLLTPAWYGHMFINPKDIPFATGMTWILYFLIRAAPHFPRVPASLVVKLGLAIGLTLGVRIAGVFAFIYVAAALGAWFVFAAWEKGLPDAIRDGVRVTLRFVLPVCLIAYAVMLAAWPWAQWNPLLRPFEALTIFSHNPWNIDTLFGGELVNSLHLPASYLPVYVAIKLPELTLALLTVAVLLAIATIRRNGLPQGWREGSGLFVLGFAVLFPFAFFIFFRPVSYDGIRHFLFVLAPIAAAAGIVLDRIFAALAERNWLWRGAFSSVIGAYAVWHGAYMAELHPNQYVYYNQLVGGVAGAENRYELDYWGNSYHEAVDRLTAFVTEEEERTGIRRGYRVIVCSSGTSAAYFFPKNFRLAVTAQEADFYISVTRLGCDKEWEGDTIITVDRDDATLSLVKDRRRLRDAAPDRLTAGLRPDHAPYQHPGLTLDGLPDLPE